MAIAAYMALKGLFGRWRASYLDPVAIGRKAQGMPDQSLSALLARLSGSCARDALLATAGAVAFGPLVFVSKDRRFRANATPLGGAIVLGLSGLSTLALGSFIAVVGIVVGAVATLKLVAWNEARAD